MTGKASPPLSILEYALKYAKKGKRIFPFYEIAENGKCSCGKLDCGSPGKHPRTIHGLKDATLDTDKIKAWWKKWPAANIAMATGQGTLVLDIDPRNGGDQSLEELQAIHDPLPATIHQKTGGGGDHFFFIYPEEFKFKSSAGELGDGLDIRAEGGAIILLPSNHISGDVYSLAPDSANQMAQAPEWLLKWEEQRHRSRSATPRPGESNVRDRIKEGQRNQFLTSEAGKLRKIGHSEAVLNSLLQALNVTRCENPLPEPEVQAIAESISKYSQGEGVGDFYEEPAPRKEKLPTPLNIKKMIYEPLRDFFVAFLPTTEASFPAMYFQALVFFGIAIGRSCYVVVPGAGRHYLNLNCCIVGKTSHSRKGTSIIPAERLFAMADPDFYPNRRVSGLSSGEGIIHAVRDRQVKVKKGDLYSSDEDEGKVIDEGEPDKRLLIIETEFSSVLINFQRRDNKLSPTLRDAWDGRDLRTLTKNSAEQATAPHVGFCAHITGSELKNLLLKVQVDNGFSNRILWVFSERSKLLSKDPPEFDFSRYAVHPKNSIRLEGRYVKVREKYSRVTAQISSKR